MRWFAPIVIVALVAAGASRPAHAARTIDRASMSASAATARGAAALRDASGSSKIAPRRGAFGRASVSDRRTDHDEVFLIGPHLIGFAAYPIVRVVASSTVDVLRPEPLSIEPVARGPPFVVVPSSPIF